MRHMLFLWLVLAGVGCHGLDGHRCRPECPVEEKKPVGAPKEKVGAPAPEVAAPTRFAAAQEVLLIPTVVYRPFVAQTPTAPVKLTSNMTVLPEQPERVSAPKPPEQPERVGAPKTEDTLRKALDHCEKLEARCADLERRLRDRAPAAAPPCPLPLLRRPLFPHFQPRCEPAPACDPAPAVPMPAPTSPMPTSGDGPVYNID